MDRMEFGRERKGHRILDKKNCDVARGDGFSFRETRLFIIGYPGSGVPVDLYVVFVRFAERNGIRNLTFSFFGANPARAGGSTQTLANLCMGQPSDVVATPR